MSRLSPFFWETRIFRAEHLSFQFALPYRVYDPTTVVSGRNAGLEAREEEAVRENGGRAEVKWRERARRVTCRLIFFLFLLSRVGWPRALICLSFTNAEQVPSLHARSWKPGPDLDCISIRPTWIVTLDIEFANTQHLSITKTYLLLLLLPSTLTMIDGLSDELGLC